MADTNMPEDLGQNIQNARFPTAINQPKTQFRQAIQSQGGGGLAQQAMREQQAARLAQASQAGTNDALMQYRATRAKAQASNEQMNRTVAHTQEEMQLARQQVQDQVAQYREQKVRQLQAMKQSLREMQARVADNLGKMGEDFSFEAEQAAVSSGVNTAIGAITAGVGLYDQNNRYNQEGQQMLGDIYAEALGTDDPLQYFRENSGVPDFLASNPDQFNAERAGYLEQLMADQPLSRREYASSFETPEQQLHRLRLSPNLSQQEMARFNETPAQQDNRLRMQGHSARLSPELSYAEYNDALSAYQDRGDWIGGLRNKYPGQLDLEQWQRRNVPGAEQRYQRRIGSALRGL